MAKTSDALQRFFAGRPAVARRIVHLDLKGMPPTPPRLLALVDLFARLRFTGILVEWEDMFPWTVDRQFRNPSAYTPQTVQAFAQRAKSRGLEIIPLVQCLGHMETPLRYRKYHHLREVPAVTTCLNPLAPGARELVEHMVLDVLALLPDVKRFHLGGDEVEAFGTHPATAAYIRRHGKGQLYRHHVDPILDLLNARQIRPILWHDMLIHWDDESQRSLGAKADICVWGYGGDPALAGPNSLYAPPHVARLARNKVRLWAGTNFRVNEDYADTPDREKTAVNVLGWARQVLKYRMEGIIVTGWGRLSTNDVQLCCLEASLDTLAESALITYHARRPDPTPALAKALNLGKRFETIQALMRVLTQNRTWARINIRAVRQLAVQAEIEPGRFDPTSIQRFLDFLKGDLKRLAQIEKDLVTAFKGLTDHRWIRDYLAVRILTLRREAVEIRKMAKAVKAASLPPRRKR